jgi:HEAT repeat protein
MLRCAALILLAIPSLLLAKDRIAYIEFFGYEGIDVRAVRQALPFREGDTVQAQTLEVTQEQARSAVRRIIGRDATDVATICCTASRGWVVFIGLPGASTRPFAFANPPSASVIAPPEFTRLYDAVERSGRQAAMNSQGEEERDAGFRLLKEPAARAAGLALRAYALGHEEEILTLVTSSDARLRANAVDALGFGRRTPRQIAALAHAVRDPDAAVRNNATRALFEIVAADPASSSQVPPGDFINMLHSGLWTDRNKASMALFALTQSRDPHLLARIQSEDGSSLAEMANWRASDWAIPARMIRERIAGKSDVWALFDGLPLSLTQGAAITALASVLLALLLVPRTSKRGSWALGLLIPTLLAILLYWASLRLRGISVSEPGWLGFWVIVLWCLAGAAAAFTVIVFSNHRRSLA